MARHIRSAIRHGARAAALWLAGAAAALAQTFSFSGYSFDDSAYLSAQDLQSIARPYVNRPITFADVEALVAEVQARYAAAGIVTARVLIEPQEVAIGGILHLSLVEARLEALEVGETSRVKARLIRKSAPLVVGDKPDFDAIAETAQLFEVAHGARYVVDFAPGDAPETTRATAKLVTAQALGWSAGADNQAAPTLGGQSATFGVSSFDRFDRLERISGSLSLNRGGQTLAGEYSFPLSVRMRGSVGVEVSQGAVVAGAARTLDIQSQRRELNVTFTGPFAIKPGGHKTWAAGARVETSRSTVLGLPLSSVRLHEVFGTVSAQRRFGPSALQTSFGLAFGRSDSGGAVTSDGTYAMATASASYARRLSPRLALEISGTAQAAPNQNLPGLRQFSLGGSSSVVGYPHFVKSGDSGFQARAQITCVDPCFGQTSGKMRISPFAFWDVGQVIEYRAPGTAARPREFLTSFGIGLNFQVGTLTLTSQLGKPLKPVSGFETDGEYAAYFGISYAF